MADNGQQQEPELMLAVAEVESQVTADGHALAEPLLRVKLKGQRPENRFFLRFASNADLIEVIHETKKRGGTLWVRFNVGTNGRTLDKAELVIRDIEE